MTDFVLAFGTPSLRQYSYLLRWIELPISCQRGWGGFPYFVYPSRRIVVHWFNIYLDQHGAKSSSVD